MCVGIQSTVLFSILIVGKVLKSFINGLGKLSVQYILKVCAIKFYYHLLSVANLVLYDLFWLHFDDFYDKDDCLHHIMCSLRHVAIAAVHE